MIRSNVVLVGFMGTGKSTVGTLAAARLGWSFVDSDAWIVQKSGMSIPELFAERGEAEFRRLETEAIRELLSGKGCVLATGGGAVLSAENRELMKEGGLVVALTASKEAIIERVQGDTNRPLLQGGVEERVTALLEARKGAYDFAEVKIDTERLSPEEVAERIVAAIQGTNREVEQL
ncbi:shikimate kinase [Paenibacillus chartarius]|uniref:Shikimate kinase n=1 Tax=Paenibacillus chartarius TaxID=747481 RepID=A0ABV6DKJ9_9BACL